MVNNKDITNTDERAIFSDTAIHAGVWAGLFALTDINITTLTDKNLTAGTWKGKFATTGDVNFTVRRNIVPPKGAYTNAEPAPSGGTVVVTTGVLTIDAANSRRDFRVDLDISDAVPSRSGGVDPFDNFGDEIWITLQYPTRGAGNFDYTKLSANYLSDFDGRHVRQ